MGEILTETRDQDTTENSNRRQTGAATLKMISQYIWHAAFQGWQVHYTHADAAVEASYDRALYLAL